LALFTDDHPCAPAKFQRIGAVYDLRVLTQLWCNCGTRGSLRWATAGTRVFCKTLPSKALR
jgi:hypothetical protein